jgi:hypothetical protein
MTETSSSDIGLNLIVGDPISRSIPVILPSTSTVADIRRVLLSNAPQIRGRRIRLIAAGRLLNDDRATFSSLNFVDGIHIHVAISEATPLGAGPSNSNGNNSGASSSTPTAPPPEAVPTSGFDRLRLIGLAGEEVEVLRQMFFPEVRPLLNSLPLLPNETEAARILRAEEIWMRSQPENSEFALNLRPILLTRRGSAGQFGNNGIIGAGPGFGQNPGRASYLGNSNSDEVALHVNDDDRRDDLQPNNPGGNYSSFICGFAMGWTLGIFMLIMTFCSTSYSRQFRLGVFSGVLFQTMTRAMLLEEEASKKDETGGEAGSISGGGSDSGSWTGTSQLVKTILET